MGATMLRIKDTRKARQQTPHRAGAHPAARALSVGLLAVACASDNGGADAEVSAIQAPLADWGWQGGLIPNAGNIPVCFLSLGTGVGPAALRSDITAIQTALEEWEKASAVRFDWRDTTWTTVTDAATGIVYNTSCAVSGGAIAGVEEVRILLDEQALGCVPVAGSLTDPNNPNVPQRLVPGCSSGFADPRGSGIWQPKASPPSWRTNAAGTCFAEGDPHWAMGRGERQADSGCWYNSNLRPWIPRFNLALHEMGHALGMVHEHERSDETGCGASAGGGGGWPEALFITEYDPASVMHYRPADPSCPLAASDSTGLTVNDVSGVGYMYPTSGHGGIVGPAIAVQGSSVALGAEWNLFPLHFDSTLLTPRWVARTGSSVILDVTGPRSVSLTVPASDVSVDFSHVDLWGTTRNTQLNIDVVTAAEYAVKVGAVVTTTPLLL